MKKTGCIVIDIGNTSTGLGFYKAGKVSCVHHVRGGLQTNPQHIHEALSSLRMKEAERVVIASVVPSINARWVRLFKKEFALPSLVVSNTTPMPIGIRYPKPETIGADRLVNACGAFVRYGAPAIVADFGTALTFDVLGKDGNYIGGVIAPGLPLMTDYLYEKTALLPRVDLSGKCPPVGTSTENAMRIGARIGHRGMVRETIHYLLDTTGKDVTLCATGGYARWALEGINMPFHIDPDLTLFGLGVIHDYQGNQI